MKRHERMNKPLAFWGLSTTEMLQRLQSAKEGITTNEAKERLARYGSNLLKPQKRTDVVTLLLTQFNSPLILILFFATGLSFFLHETVDAFIILAIVLVSGLLGFWQERSASNAVEKLLSIVRLTAAVLREGSVKEIPIEEIVPGDIVILDAGDIVPGDCLIQESKDLFVDEAMMTGETFPVEKVVAVLPVDTPLAQRTNALWMGTHVVSGSGKALVINTGTATECGKLSERLKLRPQETDLSAASGNLVISSWKSLW
jgi:Mg2+-importing ATPase